MYVKQDFFVDRKQFCNQSIVKRKPIEPNCTWKVKCGRSRHTHFYTKKTASDNCYEILSDQ